MRLIDADVMLREINDFDLEGRMDTKNFKRYINTQPTAYDMDEVIVQLRKLRVEQVLKCVKNSFKGRLRTIAYIDAIRDATEIVKKGGVR